MSLLEIKDLQVNYGEIQALKGVSLTVEEGEVVAMLGANGAGRDHAAENHQRPAAATAGYDAL